MAGQTIAIKPLFGGALAKIAGLSTRNIRLTVILCVIVICGSFAAAAVLQFRLETANANRQAAYFEARRAEDVAAMAAQTLSRQSRIGRQFAHGELLALPPDVSSIVVSDALGKVTAIIGDPIAMTSIAGSAVDHPVVIGERGATVIAFRDGIDIIAVRFRNLVPTPVLTNLEVASSDGSTIAGTPVHGAAMAANVPHWPVQVRVASENAGALKAWYGALPLYLFVILGPALVGAWLAAIFVRLGTAEMWWRTSVVEVAGADAVVVISRAGPFR